jgi:quinol monooxygenase YgiN
MRNQLTDSDIFLVLDAKHLRYKVSPNCLRYQLSHSVEEPEYYTLRIEWDSEEGHIRGFRTSPEFQPFFEAVKPFFTIFRRCVTIISRISRVRKVNYFLFEFPHNFLSQILHLLINSEDFIV